MTGLLFTDKSAAVEFANNFSVQPKKRLLPGESGSVLAGALKKQWDRESKGKVVKEDVLTGGQKKWKKLPCVPRKSAQ